MKAKNVPVYLAVVITAVFIFVAVAWIHTSESYNTAECSKKYQFLDMTIQREARYYLTFLMNPDDYYRRSTVFFVYPTHELQEKGFLDTLYSESTNRPSIFQSYGSRNTGNAVVLLKAVPSKNDGEETVFCVVGKKEVKVMDLLNDGTFSVGVQWKRTKRDLPPTERARRVVSWGPLQ